jgi:hypothetical protein
MAMRTAALFRNFVQNHVGKLQENALPEGTTLPLALTNSKETPSSNHCQPKT